MTKKRKNDKETVLNKRRKKICIYEYKKIFLKKPKSSSTRVSLKNSKKTKNKADQHNNIKLKQKSNILKTSKKNKKFIYTKRKKISEFGKVKNEEENNLLKEENNLLKEENNPQKEENNLQKEKKEQKLEEFKVDETLNRIISIKQINHILYASITKNDGSVIQKETEELKRINPFILIDFYESKIVFR